MSTESPGAHSAVLVPDVAVKSEYGGVATPRRGDGREERSDSHVSNSGAATPSADGQFAVPGGTVTASVSTPAASQSLMATTTTPRNDTAAAATALPGDATEIRRPMKIEDIATFPSAFPMSAADVRSLPTASDARSEIAGSDAGTEVDDHRVSAYARLDFESFTFYVQTLQVVLGRRAENGTGMVDVHLGPTKAISRRHAKIFYNFQTQRFELSVLGRNGAFVDDTFYESGSTVPLRDGTRIQIGQIPFTFVLPNVPAEEGADAAGSQGQHLTPADVVGSRADSGGASYAGSPMPRKSSASPDHTTDPQLRGAGGADSDAKASKKKVKKEYKPEEIPEEYRVKPNHSYSHLIATALRQRAPPRGMSLADIYKAIQEIFPYYEYCPPGWQNSVRHNLSSNRAFKKVSKEGKGFLWGIDEEYFKEKELQKQRQAMAKSKAAANAAAASNAAVATSGGSATMPSAVTADHKPMLSIPGGILSASGSADVSSTKPEREKTIAELAREIEIQRDSTYRRNYSSMTRDGAVAGGGKHPDDNGTVSGGLQVPGWRPSTTPSPNSIQAQLAANLQNRQRPHAPPAQQPSLAAGQSSFRAQPSPPVQNHHHHQQQQQQQQHIPQTLRQQTSVPSMRVQPQVIPQATQQRQHSPASGPAASAASGPTPKPTGAAAGLQLSKETMAVLGVLQKKLQSQLQNVGGSNVNSQLITNALAVVIAQAAKSGGGVGNISSILKDPSQLTQLLQKAMATINKGKSGSATPVPGPSGVGSGVPSGSSTRAASPNAHDQPQGRSASPPAPMASASPLQQAQQAQQSPESEQAQPVQQPAQMPERPPQQPLGQSTVATNPVPPSGSPPARSPSQTAAPAAAAAATAAPGPAPATAPAPASTTASAASVPAAPKQASPPPAPGTATGQKKPTTAAEIARVLEQASKIPNPSPSVRAALEQLRAKLDALRAQEARKRPSEEPLEQLDSSSVKNFKGAA